MIGGPIAIVISTFIGLLIIDKHKLFYQIQLLPCTLIFLTSIIVSNTDFFNNSIISLLFKLIFQLINISIICILNKKLRNQVKLVFKFLINA